MSKLISIIINCYNGEKFLKKTLESIINQEYENWEVIFWDNQSSDNSRKIFNLFSDDRLKYFYAEEHTTLYKARNLACEHASGEFIAFVDCDDWWETNFLEIRKDFFLSKKYDFSYSNCMHYFQKTNKFEILTNKKLKSGQIFDFLSKKYLVKISCFIIRKSVFEKENKFNENYNTVGDFEYVMRISEKYFGLAIQEPLATIRFHDKNFLDHNRKMFYQEYLDWFKNINFNNINYSRNKFFYIKELIRLKILSILPRLIINKFKKK